jgi:hypothetical protein
MLGFSPTLTRLSRAAMMLALAVAASTATGSIAHARPAAPAGKVADGDTAITVTGFDSPESAVHDPLTDVYLVSNIGGAVPAAAFAKDGNGFISKIAPDGTVLDREWIGLGRNGVTLDAPKGLAINQWP